MKKKYVFPEKWKILITKENFDIVTPYYAKAGSCYTDSTDAIGEWIRSHNRRDQQPFEDNPDASFFALENEFEFTTITVGEFQEYVLNKEHKIEDMSYLIPFINQLNE